MKHTTILKPVALLAFAGLTLPLSGEFMVLRETFDFEGELNGRTPTVASAGVGVWSTASTGTVYTANGSVLPGNTANLTANLGGFSIESGRVYELSMDVSYASSHTSFFGIGFLTSAGTLTANFTNAAFNTILPAWMFLRANGEAVVRLAGGSAPNLYASGTGVFPFGDSPHTMKLAIDTRPEQWQLSAWVNSVQLDLNESDPMSMVYTWAENPVINLVGLTHTSQVVNPQGTADNFQLYSIPEPATWALLLACAAAVMAVRKRFSLVGSVRYDCSKTRP